MDCSSVFQSAHAAGTTVCIITPFDWRTYITPVLVACSALIAILAMRTTRSVARQRATLDLIEKRESTEHYRQIATAFSRLRRDERLTSLNKPTSVTDKADRQTVVDYLNHYELISIGILNGILDETIYRTWMRGPFVRDWNAASAWIQRERWKRDEAGTWIYYESLFENYQKVALRWSADTVLLHRASSSPPSDKEAGGPGDETMPPPRRDDAEQSADSN